MITFPRGGIRALLMLAICVLMAVGRGAQSIPDADDGRAAIGEAHAATITLAQRCRWGAPGPAPTAFGGYRHVLMTPVVANLNVLTAASEVAFISYHLPGDAGTDSNGVLRVIDNNCNLIASFPDPTLVPLTSIPSSCVGVLNNSTPNLAPVSGLAVGNIDPNPGVEIIAVIAGSSAPNHTRIAAFNLAILPTPRLVPVWCSPALGAGDFILGPSTPAIAQLDDPASGMPAQYAEIVVDNKVYGWNGTMWTLRYSGVNGPRSRTALVANVHASSNPLPQLITGRGVYNSNNLLTWTGTPGWVTSAIAPSSDPQVFAAVADMDLDGKPELVVTDPKACVVNVFNGQTGAYICSTLPFPIPGCIPAGKNPPFGGGPPMIGNAIVTSTPDYPEVGIATATQYTLFKFTPGATQCLTKVWSMPIVDHSAQTTSTLANVAVGPQRIYYNDEAHLYVFDGGTGTLLQPAILNNSATGIEGPIVVDIDNLGLVPVVIVAASLGPSGGNYLGVRIFNEDAIRVKESVWNQHSYHITNVTSSAGTIPVSEPPGWLTRNNYRVQR